VSGLLRRILPRVAIGVVAAAGLSIGIWRLHGHYPIDKWLVWAYVPIWLACLGWVIACLSAGHLIIRHALRLSLPLREHALFAFAVGVLAFVLGLFLIGLVSLLGPAAFVAWPLVMIAAGIVPLVRFTRRVMRLIRWARRRPGLLRPSPVRYALILFGAAGALALYLNILTPSNLAYDTRWYHLGMAEHYAVTHRIGRFPEGWFAGALPQLASQIYTWAFLFPGQGLFTHIETAAHLEFVLLLATLAGIPLLVRRLVGGRSVPQAWAAFFLFPGIFIYDSAPSAAADHVLAFWAVPLYLAALRFWRSWHWKDGCLVAAMAAGAALTKYQSLYLLAPIGAAVGGRTLFLAWRTRALRATFLPVLAAAGAFVLLTAPHWLKNLVWYGDPVYPLLHNVLNLRPWNPDADPVTTLQSGGFKPTGPLSTRLLDSMLAMATFGFQAHDWGSFHRDWPTFGFLFTLLVPFVLLLRQAARLRVIAGACLLGVFLWFFTFHQDRYLQSLTPWMAALVAAVIWRLWHAGLVARISIVPLVALQLMWGGDHYFLPTHAMIGQQPVRVTMDLLSSGFRGQFSDRFQVNSDLGGVAKTLPPKSRVLLHEQHLRLGAGVPVVADARGTQGAFSYRRERSARGLWDRWRAMGVTHVMWPASPIGLETYGDEIVFYGFAKRDLIPRGRFGGLELGELPKTPPSAEPFGPVALQGCSLSYRVPLSRVDTDIWVQNGMAGDAQKAENQRGIEFIVLETACRGRYPTVAGFDLVTSRNGWETWARRR
jgi:hypothetical protein